MTRETRIVPIPRPNNMGLVRYYLAFSVVIAHFNELAGADFFWPTTSYDAVGGFFALSGFLVYGSYLKKGSSLKYLKDRALRILPPYFLIVLLCAFLMCLISSLPAWEYFSSGQWWGYLAANLSFLNFLQPALPGVFEGFKVPAVNGALWTMKIEWFLYFSVPVIVWLYRKFRTSPITMFATVYVLSLAYRLVFYRLGLNTGSEVYVILGRQAFGQLMYFVCGMAIYGCFHTFMKHKWAILAIAVVLYAVSFINVYADFVLRPISLACILIMVSMTGKWGVWAGDKDNFSYDVYLFHFPVIQTLVYLGIMEHMSPLSALVTVCAATSALAWLSWHLVGKQALKLRKR